MKIIDNIKKRYKDVQLKIAKGLEINRFKGLWVDLMVNLNALNLNRESFGLNYVEITDFGYKAIICIPLGFEYEDLIEYKSKIETGLNCRFITNPRSAKGVDMTQNNLVEAEFIKIVDMNIDYRPVKVENPTDIYIANNYIGEPVIIDFLKFPNTLITGAPRCGKTKMLQLILINLSANFSKDLVEFYLFQIDRSDMILLKNNKNTTKFVRQDYNETLEVLRELHEIVTSRDEQMLPYTLTGESSNYTEYNRIPGHKKLSTIYVAIDELASIQDKGDRATKDVREEIAGELRFLVSKGAMCGVYMLLSLQRPDANNLDTFIKAACTLKVSFRANNSKSSEVATDDAKIALALKQREFVYEEDGIWNYGIVPRIETKEYINM